MCILIQAFCLIHTFGDRYCQQGIISMTAEEPVCCPSACGECGGDNCSSRPGAGVSCCTSAILNSEKSCNDYSPPCIIYANLNGTQTFEPTFNPSLYPTTIPSITPTNDPTVVPTTNPSEIPTNLPSLSPSNYISSPPPTNSSSTPSSSPITSAIPSQSLVMISTAIQYKNTDVINEISTTSANSDEIGISNFESNDGLSMDMLLFISIILLVIISCACSLYVYRRRTKNVNVPMKLDVVNSNSRNHPSNIESNHSPKHHVHDLTLEQGVTALNYKENRHRPDSNIETPGFIGLDDDGENELNNVGSLESMYGEHDTHGFIGDDM